MSWHVGAMLDRFIHLETIILNRVKVLAYAQMGKHPETLRAAENAIRLANSPSIITTTAAALAHVGQSREAKQLLSKALEQAKERYICRFLVADTYVELGDTEKAFESLEQGFLQRST